MNGALSTVETTVRQVRSIAPRAMGTLATALVTLGLLAHTPTWSAPKTSRGTTASSSKSRPASVRPTANGMNRDDAARVATNSKTRAGAVRLASMTSGTTVVPASEVASELSPDVLVVGGSAGGTAAAIAAAQSGVKVVLLEETAWLGGQLTTQGVSMPDEHRYINQFGSTATYAQFREGIRRYYQTNYRLSAQAARNPHFNPGSCWVGLLAYEPKVGVQVLREMVRPLEQAGRLQISYRTRVVAVEMNEAGTRIETVVAERADGARLRFTPRYVLDATDLGDVLALAGRPGEDWVVGEESRAETGEPDAPEAAQPDRVQPFTFPFALDWSPKTARTNVIPRPAEYERLKAEQQYSVRGGAITGVFQGAMPWWSYRRMLAAANFNDPRIPADLAMINTHCNDYRGDDLLGAEPRTPEEAQGVLARAKQAALGYAYWLQTECPREDDPTGRRRGYPEFRLRRDVFDTPDGLPVQPYIRESRRIRSLRLIKEQEIVVRDRQGRQHQTNARAAFMSDSVGVGHYALDIHVVGQSEGVFLKTRPFQIPLGALVPVRLENLLPACKNLGVTHLANGAYRLHPIEWNVGEAAGTLAVFCLRSGLRPQEAYADVQARGAYQTWLLRRGMPLYWFVDVPSSHAAFEAVQSLAMAGAPITDPQTLTFRPNTRISAGDWKRWRQAIGAGPATFTGTRAQAAVTLYRLYAQKQAGTRFASLRSSGSRAQ